MIDQHSNDNKIGHSIGNGKTNILCWATIMILIALFYTINRNS